MLKPRKPLGPLPTGEWPAHIPGGETALDRAREIARGALRELARHAPREAEAMILTACAFGETWVRPHLDTSHPDDLMTADQVALRAGVRVGTVYVWTNRGISSPEGRVKLHRLPGGYAPQDVDDFLRRRDTPKKHTRVTSHERKR